MFSLSGLRISAKQLNKSASLLSKGINTQHVSHMKIMEIVSLTDDEFPVANRKKMTTYDHPEF